MSLPVVVTESPRSTIETLKALHAALEDALTRYTQNRSKTNFEIIILIRDEIALLIDLEAQALATRGQVGTEITIALLDIYEHLQPLDLKKFPDAVMAAKEGLDHFPLPGTPLSIRKVVSGTREGEYLFSANTVVSAPRFVEFLKASGNFDTRNSWTSRMHQLTGPWFPAALVGELPESLKGSFLGAPIWKLALAVVLVAALIATCFPLIMAVNAAARSGKISKSLRQALASLIILCAVLLYRSILGYQILLVGAALSVATVAVTLALFLVLAWVFWRMSELTCNAYIGKESPGHHRVDDNFTRLIFHLIGLIGGIWLIAYGAQSLGFPLLSILAGLGVGGLAVALAIRPTLENLISGFVLYLEQSVKVGDYCSFGQQEGTIESIGIRSTHVRSLDRTLISIPNSKFVDMALVNWAECDEMLINETIGLRYETNTDQLRYVLAEVRAMFYKHPRINSDNVRVRFAGYGASSLDVDIRVYAKTREWNDFYAIREDVLFRVKEIVEASGTGFAFPSQTVYVKRDSGLDKEKSDRSIEKVGKWRQQRKFPFPNFSAKSRQDLDGTLPYPPIGSPEAVLPGHGAKAPDEPLVIEEPLSAVREPDVDAASPDQPGSKPTESAPQKEDEGKVK